MVIKISKYDGDGMRVEIINGDRKSKILPKSDPLSSLLTTYELVKG